MSKIPFSCLILAICLFGFGETIFNGMPSDRGEHPFYVFLEIDRNNSNKQGCGGVLAGNAFVITAAHCVDQLIDNVRLHFGVHQTKKTEENGREIVTVHRDNIYIHPSFSRTYMQSDIAIIKLDVPIEHSRYIQSAQFASNCVLDEFTDAVTAGCGYLSSHGQIAEFLQWTPMSTVSRDECFQVFPELRQNAGAFCVANQDFRSLCEVNISLPIICPNNYIERIVLFE